MLDETLDRFNSAFNHQLQMNKTAWKKYTKSKKSTNNNNNKNNKKKQFYSYMSDLGVASVHI